MNTKTHVQTRVQACETWNDDKASLMTTRHILTDEKGEEYHVYYVGFNFTSNIAGDDAAFVQVIHNGITYTNLPCLSDIKYANIDYIFNNQACRQCYKGPNPENHGIVGITKIDIENDRMTWYVSYKDMTTPVIVYVFHRQY